jgi:hypothetical protein
MQHEKPRDEIARRVISVLYAKGVHDALKALDSLETGLQDGEGPTVHILRGALDSLKQMDTNHVVAEAVLRQDQLWVSSCIRSLDIALQTLILDEQERDHLRATKEVLEIILGLVQEGRKPPLGG